MSTEDPVLLDAPPSTTDRTEIVVPPERALKTADMYGLLRQRYSTVATGNGGMRYVLAPEVRNQAGFGDYTKGSLRTCDLMVMDTWDSGPCRLIGHEIKVSRSDWLRELKDPEKANAFLPYVAEWWLVVSDRRIVRDGELPDGWGLLAPAGKQLRAIVRAPRKDQPPVPTGMLAALLRSVSDQRRAATALVSESIS